MQRPATSYRAPDEHSINIMQLTPVRHSPRRGIDGTSDLPIYEPRSSIGRRDTSRSRMSEKWVHLVPVIVLLCLFVLWWFSYPVSLTIKDGRITEIHRIDRLLNLNDTRVDLTILALAAPPHALVPDKLTLKNETEAYPISEI